MAKKQRKVGATTAPTSGKPKHSLDSNRASKADLGKRDASTVRRLQMYKKKAVRDKNGKLIYQEYQNSDLPTTRIQPDRRWFGNTRVIGQKQLEQFRTEMSAKVNDAYTVLLREKKLPLQLLEDPDKKRSGKEVKARVLNSFSFSDTFGPGRKRKRPKLMAESLDDLVATAEQKEETFGARPSGVPATLADELKDQVRDAVFDKGQSRRIWGELYKVLDSSDVVIQVLDARDPEGTRCRFLEHHIRTNARHKHLLLLLNKCDLVPSWVTKRWLHHLSREFPTLAFHASITNPFGKGALLSLLRQLARLRSDKQAISVGFVGYPNVGKSSVINTLRTKKVCKTAPVPGETKVWQYITLMKRIFLIDCPGVVYNKTSDSQSDAVLKGVVRVENLADAAEHVKEVLRRVKPEYLRRAYKVAAWSSDEHFLEQLARLTGKLHRGGEPDLNTAAKMVLYDWQRGKIPFFSLPPGHTAEPVPAGAVAAGAEALGAGAGAGGELGGQQQQQAQGQAAGVAEGGVPANAVTEEDAQAEAGAVPEAAAAAAKAVVQGVRQAARQQQRGALPQQQGYFLPEDEAGEGAGQLDSDAVSSGEASSGDGDSGSEGSDEVSSGEGEDEGELDASERQRGSSQDGSDAEAGVAEEQQEQEHGEELRPAKRRKAGSRQQQQQQQRRRQQQGEGSGDESDGYGEGGLSFEAVMAMMQGAAAPGADSEAAGEQEAEEDAPAPAGGLQKDKQHRGRQQQQGRQQQGQQQGQQQRQRARTKRRAEPEAAAAGKAGGKKKQKGRRPSMVTME